VGDIDVTGKAIWRLCVPPTATLPTVLEIQNQAAKHGMPAGIALVVDAAGKLLGTITDGDVRRAILRNKTIDVAAADAMNARPIAFADGMSFREILGRLPAELERRGRSSRTFLGKIVLVDPESRPARVLDYHQLWEQRVATHRHVVVVGVGYVGLTLAIELAAEGFRVTGIDADPAKVAALQAGRSDVHEVGLAERLREQHQKNFFVSDRIPAGGDVFVLAVGTPVANGDGGPPVPKLDHVREAAELVGRHLPHGGLVVLRSTVPVGTTRQVVLPILERASGMRGGVDFHLAFAPERTIEGKALQELRLLPQLIGGINQDSVEATAALFRELSPTMVRVDSLEAAEMAKLINNAYRDHIFAFANQVAQVSAIFNLDVAEVIRAANRGYPRDTVPMPSPGVGGPCLTKDPYILAWAAAQAGMPETIFTHGRRVNESMHGFVVQSVLQELRALGKDPRACSLLVCGLAFKGRPETGDLRFSSGVEIARLLQKECGELHAHDPVASAADIAAFGLRPALLPEAFADKDVVLFLNNHPSYEKLDVFQMVRSLRAPGIVYDGWHLFRPEDVLSACPTVYLGLGFRRSSAPGASP
jgi:nucleotide sugar dehydrogenase